MARKTNARTVANRAALDQIRRGQVEAMEALGRRVIEQADAPDAPPIGEGLVGTGAWGVWVEGKKVGGEARKPRGLKVKRSRIVMAVGFGFPGRFNETGTIKQPPRPFLTPSFIARFGTREYLDEMGDQLRGFLRRR